jgi:hypothetical protein
MFDKVSGWFKKLMADREAALHALKHAESVEHGHVHDHIDGIVHTHQHGHGDHEHDHTHDGEAGADSP